MDVLLAVLGIMLAVAGVGVMITQVCLARKQQELFVQEKRYAFYDAIMWFLHQGIVYGRMEHPEITREFYRQSRLALFLFDKSIREYVEQIDRKFMLISVTDSGKQKLGLQRWFAARYSKAPDVFSEYLSLPPRK